MSAESLSFRCRPRLGTALVWVLFACLLTAGLAAGACTNKYSLVIAHTIRLSTNVTTVVLWLLAVVGAFMVLLQGRIVYNRRVHEVPDFVLTDTSFSFPVEFPKECALVLPLREIENVWQSKLLMERFLMLKTATTTHQTALDWLESDEDGESLVKELADRWSAALRGTV